MWTSFFALPSLIPYLYTSTPQRRPPFGKTIVIKPSNIPKPATSKHLGKMKLAKRGKNMAHYGKIPTHYGTGVAHYGDPPAHYDASPG